eukprot:638009-Lingulodinium_polyedra.AAC.1
MPCNFSYVDRAGRAVSWTKRNSPEMQESTHTTEGGQRVLNARWQRNSDRAGSKNYSAKLQT